MKDRSLYHIRLTDGKDDDREYLEYWLSRPPGERIAAVELLREQFYPDRREKNSPRLVRSITIREIP